MKWLKKLFICLILDEHDMHYDDRDPELGTMTCSICGMQWCDYDNIGL